MQGMLLENVWQAWLHEKTSWEKGRLVNFSRGLEAQLDL